MWLVQLQVTCFVFKKYWLPYRYVNQKLNEMISGFITMETETTYNRGLEKEVSVKQEIWSVPILPFKLYLSADVY